MNKGKFRFTVEAEVELAEGRASTREFVGEELRLWLQDDGNPGSVYPDSNEYTVTNWDVTPS